MKNYVLSAAYVIALYGLSLGPLSAGPITLTSGALTSVITFDGTFTFPTGVTINGIGILNVNNTGSSTVNIATDVGAAAPNLFLTALNAGITEFLTLGFDPLTIAMAPDKSFFGINALGVPGGTITDTGLAALTGTTSWVFGFTTGGPGQTDITYNFVSGTANDTLRGSEIPEPATMALFVAGFGALALIRRRRA